MIHLHWFSALGHTLFDLPINMFHCGGGLCVCLIDFGSQRCFTVCSTASVRLQSGKIPILCPLHHCHWHIVQTMDMYRNETPFSAENLTIKCDIFIAISEINTIIIKQCTLSCTSPHFAVRQWQINSNSAELGTSIGEAYIIELFSQSKANYMQRMHLLICHLTPVLCSPIWLIK